MSVQQPARAANPGDWTCSLCQNLNFARRDECNRCKAPRPAGGADSARGGGGRESGGARGDGAGRGGRQFDSERRGGGGGGRNHRMAQGQDWKCEHCGNLNWPKRLLCNECQKPRFRAEREERTGRAGGHYERDEYEERSRRSSRRAENDDDDLYDDMGRLKKEHRDKRLVAATQEELMEKVKRGLISDTAPAGSHSQPDANAHREKRDSPPHHRQREHSRERERSRDRGRERDNERDRERSRDNDRQRSSRYDRYEPRSHSRYSRSRSPQRR